MSRLLSLFLLASTCLFAGGLESRSPLLSPSPKTSKQAPKVLKSPFRDGERLRAIVVLNDESISQKTVRLKRSGKRMTDAEQTRWGEELAAKRASAVQSWKSNKKILTSGREFGYLLNGVSVEISLSQLEALRADERVKGVWYDHPAEANLTDVFQITRAQSAWDLTGADNLPVRGSGVTVAVIDSGVDYTHPALGGGFGPGFKVIGGYDFLDDDADPMDTLGHGTHVAGIIGANGEEGQPRGLAPAASLLAYRVLREDGGGESSTVIAAIERAVQDGADIINLSLSTTGSENDALSQAVNNAVDSGVLVVASAGNNGGVTGGIRSPGAAARALTVGSTNNFDGLSEFSSTGPAGEFSIKPELVAPGENITSTTLNGNYGDLSGTSMSAAVVSASAALLKQIYPDWSQDRLANRLIHTTRILVSGVTNVGTGRVDLEKAVTSRVDINERVLNFETVDRSLPNWIENRFFTLTNPTSEEQSYTFSSLDNFGAQGGGIIFVPSSVTLAPGASEEINARVIINNSNLDYPRNDTSTYEGPVLITGGEDTYAIGFALRKSIKFSLGFGEPGFYNFRISSFEQSVLRQELTFDNNPLVLHLRPATYDLLGVADPVNDPTDFFFFNIEDNLVFDDITVTLDDTVASNRVNLQVIDMQGVSNDVTFYETMPSVHSLTHLPSESVFVYSTDRGALPRFTDLSSDWSFDSVGLLPLGSNEFAETTYRFKGISGNQNFISDLRQTRPITFRQPIPEETGSQVELSWEARSRFSPGDLSLQLDSLIPSEYSRAPFTATFYVHPTGLLDGEDELDIVGFRRFRYEAGSLVNPQIFTSPWILPVDQETIAVTGNSLRTSFVSNSDEFPLGNSLLFPSFRIAPTQRGGLFLTSGSSGPGMLTDSRNNSATSPAFGYLFEIEEQGTAEGNSFADLQQFLLNFTFYRTDRVNIDINYHSYFEGQPINGLFQTHFELDRENFFPPSLNGIDISQNGVTTGILTGPAQITFSENELSSIAGTNATLEVNPDQTGWITVQTSTSDSTSYNADLPVFDPGTFVGLRIRFEDRFENWSQNTFEEFYRVGVGHIIPWVVNNSQWQSRIAIFNDGEEDVTAYLKAYSANGDAAQTTVNVPSKGVFAAQAGDLFADLSGYSLQIFSNSELLYPSFLTFNKETESGGNSPSQTTAATFADLSNRVMFNYVPGSQLPAIVLSAPSRANSTLILSDTEVNLELFDGSGLVVDTNQVTLSAANPSAFLVTDLFPNLPADATIVASAADGTHLAGVTFTFNNQREPSMTAGLAKIQTPTPSQTIPWVVNSSQWQSRLSFFNQADVDGVLNLRAVTTSGETQTASMPINQNSVIAMDASELFADLTGYSLFADITTENDTELYTFGDLYASFLTFNKEVESGGNSPSQTTATQPGELATELVFGYVPTDQIPALVINAPGAEGDTSVTLTAYGPDGGAIGNAEITLTGEQPFAGLVNSLFVDLPVDVTIRAQSENPMAGTMFVFNQQREPSMAKPFTGK